MFIQVSLMHFPGLVPASTVTPNLTINGPSLYSNTKSDYQRGKNFYKRHFWLNIIMQ